MLKKTAKFLINGSILFIIIINVIIMINITTINLTSANKDAEQSALDKGKKYDLPIEDSEKEEAEADCKEVMELIFEIYTRAEKGESFNVSLSDDTVLEMQNKVGDAGYPVITEITYSNMKNYEKIQEFLWNCEEGKEGSVVLYKILSDGGVGRMKYTFDGEEMYLFDANAIWNEKENSGLTYLTNAKIEEWRYSDKGWFCYKVCVPQPPEVTEIVDGSCLIRIKPMTEECRKLSEKCVKILGYKGNNLLCSNWSMEDLEELDFNGIYEYFYEMKYKKDFPSEKYLQGIPQKEFEALIMEYLPVTAEQIRKYGVFDKKSRTYQWASLQCFNYSPTFFGTSVPEVTQIRKNDDGTVTLTVDAVCEMIECDEALITHELTISFGENEKFQYLGNKILWEGEKKIPEYQRRVK